MDRRDFLKYACEISTGFFLPSNLIKNSEIYSEEESNPKKIFTLSFYELEQIIMIKSLILKQNASKLSELCYNFDNELYLKHKIGNLKRESAEIALKNIKKFSRKTASKEQLKNTLKKLDKIELKIEMLKTLQEADVINFKRKKYFLSGNEYHYCEDLSLINKLEILNGMNDEGEDYARNKYKFLKTLQSLASDSIFIKKASESSGIPLEEILAFIHIESGGKEFTVSRYGAVNRFQLNPKFLRDLYLFTAHQNNDLSSYIKENTSRKTFLHDLVNNSELNIAVGVNLMKHLKNSTKNYYDYVVSYNRGIDGTINLPKKIRTKLKNHEKISEKDLKYHPVKYYSDFLSSIKTFEKIKQSLI